MLCTKETTLNPANSTSSLTSEQLIPHCLPRSYSKGNCCWEEQGNTFGRVFKNKWQLIFCISAIRPHQKRPVALSGNHCAISGVWNRRKAGWKPRLGNEVVGLNCLLSPQGKYNPFFRNSSKKFYVISCTDKSFFPSWFSSLPKYCI